MDAKKVAQVPTHSIVERTGEVKENGKSFAYFGFI